MKKNKFKQYLYQHVSIIICLMSFAFFAQAQVVVIDPGHGYNSNGTNVDGRTTTEIYTALSASLKLRDLINNSNCGWTVHMTRTTNGAGGWTSVSQRALMSNNWNATRFISIHCNGGGGTGTETFYCNQSASSTADDLAFANIIQNDMVQYGQWTDRRVAEDDSYLNFHLGVLRTNNAPACLSEIGFVDSADETKLLSNSWRDKFALAYFESLKDELGNCSSNPPSGGGNCPVTQSLATPIQPNTYEASSSITASNVVSFGTVNFFSPDISLNNGFEVTGGVFYAENAGCTNNKIISSDIENLDLSIQPNPFSSHTNIGFSLSKEQPVTILVNDVSGKLIYNVINKQLKAKGKHHITFKADNLMSGMYYVTVKTDNNLTTQKMILNN